MPNAEVPAGAGAIDLSQVATPQPSTAVPVGQSASAASTDPTGPVISAPLITDVDEFNFEDVMALSQTVPVVLVLYAPNSLTSKQAVAVMEDVTRAAQGAFQLGRVDVEANPTLASAFQLQAIPAAVAVVARRPVPLFEGAPTESQVQSILSELFQVTPQLGVIGRIEVQEADLEKPMPPEHSAAREAEQGGDWDGAIAAWKKVLASNPADQEAKTALVRAQFEVRQEQADRTDTESVDRRADELFAKGYEREAFDLLLASVGEAAEANQRDALRQHLIELFQIASDREAVKKARTQLATMLLV